MMTSMILINEKEAADTIELLISIDFSKVKISTCVNSGGINVIFNIPYEI